ncbi:calcium-binding protein [Tabrizicola oligotrophica]|uniref:Calcium-binding protein n=1 Tax=Tabrizicola oligotrophica TaxID=2710650 RepID=A0A6M0QXS0_9RHOB|nr:calcium-binding protein [Tabrizicola oligotrophica]NEY92259.1 calcium-binding protein [Tabrizicola oligotrophica]
MALPNIYEVTQKYLYGQNETPVNFFTNAVLTRGSTDQITVDLADIFNPLTGPGRFANAATSPLVEFFFEEARSYWETGALDHLKNTAGEIILSKAEAIAAFDLGSTDNGIYVDSKDFIDGTDDYAERVYIWGTMAFKLADDAVFRISADGTVTIENFSIEMRHSNEDFDWQGGSFAGNYGSENGLRPGVDPSDLADSQGGRALVINYGGDFSGQFDASYTYNDYLADLDRYSDQYDASYGQLVDAMNSVIGNLYASGVTATLYQNKAVLFGTEDGDDNISGTVSAAGYDISDTGNFLLFGSVDFPLSAQAGDGIVYVTGGGEDTVTGTSKDDLILDGAGADTYNGRGGFDFISYTESTEAVHINLGAGTGAGGTAEGDRLTRIEAVLGTAQGDTLVTNGDQVTVLAGGAGDDLFEIDLSGTSPTIVWGGAGADTIRLQADESGQAAGILVVQSSNITEENFHLIDLESLGLGSSFDWSQIDVVVINPDPSDQVQLADALTAHTIAVATMQEPVIRYIQTESGDLVAETYGQLIYDGYEDELDFANVSIPLNGEVKNYDQTFLSGYAGQVFAPAQMLDFLTIVEYKDSEGETFVQVLGDPETGEHVYSDISLAQGLGLGGSGWDYEIDRDYNFSSAAFVSQWTTEDGSYGSREHFFYRYLDAPIDGAVGWFVVGGSFDGSALLASSSGAQLRTFGDMDLQAFSALVGGASIILTLPDPSTSGSDRPRGGSYGYAEAVSNLSSADSTQQISYFNSVSDTVVIDGQAINGSNLPAGVVVREVDGSVVIDYAGDGSAIILRGVELVDWLAGAQAQLQGTSAADSLTGTADGDVLAGGSGNDTIVAGAGNDRINYASGNDVIMGDASNEGTDTLDLRRFNASDVRFKIAGSDVLIITSDGTILLNSQVLHDLGDTFSNIEVVLFNDVTLDEAGIRSRAIADQITSGDDSIFGTAFADAIYGDAGNDTIFGAGGNDTLFGGVGNDLLDGDMGTDSMSGGVGDDTYVVDSATDLVVENAGEGTDLVLASASLLLGADVENLTLTGAETISGTGNAAGNTLTGNAAANLLSGLGGNDSLYAGDGADTLDGGTGADLMTGGLGNDTYFVDNAADAIVETDSGGFDAVQSSVTFTLAAEVENLTLSGTAAINGTGNTADNLITGNAAANSLSGLDGNDSLYGSGGVDSLYGGDGNDYLNGGAQSDYMAGGAENDTYVVNAAQDVVFEGADSGVDLVQSNVNWTLGSNIENLFFYSNGSLTGNGNTLANTLTGNAGANTLNGLVGDDSLIGGGGNDTLNGGTGADQFVFNSTTSGIDVIADFNELDGGNEEGDVLRFDGLTVGTFAYLGTSAFSGGSDNSEARVVGNQVLFDANGDGTADITITLTGLTAATQLAATDFLLV